jgi:hypothetical protein
MMLLRGQLHMREDLLTDYQLKSHMTGDCHVRFREGLGGKFPRSTRLPYNAFKSNLLLIISVIFNSGLSPEAPFPFFKLCVGQFTNISYTVRSSLHITTRRFNEVPSVSELACVFAKSR